MRTDLDPHLGALLRQSRGAAGFREVPSGVLTRHVSYGIAIVHLSDYQDDSRLLGYLESIAIAQTRVQPNHQSPGNGRTPERLQCALAL
jgi:hypothetical protein